MIDRFKGQYRFLSNFFIEPDGSCVENEFQAFKANDLLLMAHTLLADTPTAAKQLGRKVSLIDNWDQIRIHVMGFLVLKKFLDHKDLGARLFDTGDETLIEGNTWGDTFWGVCDGDGLNCLGEILMAVRAILPAVYDE